MKKNISISDGMDSCLRWFCMRNRVAQSQVIEGALILYFERVLPKKSWGDLGPMLSIPPKVPKNPAENRCK